MIEIKLENVYVDFPILGSQNRSIKKAVLRATTGGRIASDAKDAPVVRALDGISFTMKEGDRVGLLGANGAGKSTLLRVLAGVYCPTSGRISVTGSIGTLLDIGLGTDNESTGLQNIELRGTLLGMSPEEIKRQTPEIVEFTELGEFIHLPMKTYSSGMQVRVAFTVSTQAAPEILLMDEWLAVGDQRFQEKAQERLSKFVNRTKILVLASHSRELIESVCNRALWFDHGKLIADGPVKEVCAKYFGG